MWSIKSGLLSPELKNSRMQTKFIFLVSPCCDPPAILISPVCLFSVLCTDSCECCMLSRFSRVHLCATLWTAARQAPLSLGASRQEHWSGLLCPPPGLYFVPDLLSSWTEHPFLLYLLSVPHASRLSVSPMSSVKLLLTIAICVSPSFPEV